MKQPKSRAQRTEEVRINALMGQLEKSLAGSFMAMLRRAWARTTDQHSNTELARIVEQEAEKYADALASAFAYVGQLEADRITRQLGLKKPVVFDVRHPGTARLIANAKRRFLMEFARNQRSAIIQASVRSQKGTLSAAVIQKARRKNPAREALGLTPYQEQIVENYRGALAASSQNALDRKLRDRRFDSTVQSVVDGGEPLSWAQINRMTDRYRERWITHRANTIARTESLITVNTARHAAMTQASEQANFDPDTIVRTWNAVDDSLTRDTHSFLDGVQVDGMDTPFESDSGALLMYPGDPSAPAEEIVNCRCWVTYELPNGDEEDEDDDL